MTTYKGLSDLRILSREYLVAIYSDPFGVPRYLRNSLSLNTETTIFPSEARIFTEDIDAPNPDGLEAATLAADNVVKVYADLGLSVSATVLRRKVFRMNTEWEPATENVGAAP